MLSYLNGVNKNKMNNQAQINGWFTDFVDNVSNTVQNTFQNISSGVTNVINQAQQFAQNLPKITLPNINLTNLSNKIKTISVAPARAAALFAIKNNYLKLADRLADAYKINPSSVSTKWVNGYGGNLTQLKTAINEGTTGAKINGNVDPEQIIKLIGVGLPILAGLIAIIRSVRGARDTQDQAGDQKGINDLAKNVNDTPIDVLNTTPPEVKEGIDTKTMLLIGGGVVVVGGLIYFLTKKK